MEKKQRKHIHDAFGGTLYRHLPQHSFLHVTRLQNVWFVIVEAEKLLAPFEWACAVGLNHQRDSDSGVFDVIWKESINIEFNSLRS